MKDAVHLVKRITFIFLTLALGLTAFAGCSDGDGNAGTESFDETAPVTIKVGIWAFDSDAASLELWKGYEAEMKEKYPNITLQPEPYSYSPDTFIPMAVSGTAPNIFETRFTEPNRLISNGYVADITAFAEKYGYKNGMEKNMLDVAVSKKKIYGIPRAGYALSLMLNVEMFRKANLLDANGIPIYPKTYTELAETAKKIKAATGKAGIVLPTRNRQGGWQFSNIAWSFGAKLQFEDGGKWKNGLAGKESVNTLKYYKDLRWTHDVLPADTLIDYEKMYQIFGTGEAAMMLAGSDSFIRPVRDYGMSKDSIAVVPLPEGPGGQYSLLGGNLFMFSAKSSAAQLDACFKLLKTIGASPDPDEQTLKAIEDEILSRKANNYPIGPTGLNVWSNPERVKAENELYEKYTNVNMKLFQPFYDKVYDTLHAEEPYFCQDMYASLDIAIQQCMTDKNADVQKELNKAAADFQTFLDQAY